MYRKVIKRKRGANIYLDDGVVCNIIVYGVNHIKRGEVLIDSSDVEKCKKVKWFIRMRNGAPMSVAGHTEEKRNMRMHYFLFGKPPEGYEYDHINRNPLDNRKENLRRCTFNQNQRNQGPRKHNTSGYKGVTKTGNGWCARIWVNSEPFYLGFFKEKEKAALAYNSAAKAMHKDFAYLNEVSNV